MTPLIALTTGQAFWLIWFTSIAICALGVWLHGLWARRRDYGRMSQDWSAKVGRKR